MTNITSLVNFESNPVLKTLRQKCEDMGIKFIIVEDCDMPDDLIIYSSQLKIMSVNETVTEKSMHVAIQFLQGGGVTND